MQFKSLKDPPFLFHSEIFLKIQPIRKLSSLIKISISRKQQEYGQVLQETYVFFLHEDQNAVLISFGG